MATQVEVYDAKKNEWSVATLSEMRVGFAAVSVGNEAIFAYKGTYETRNARRTGVSRE